MMKGTGRLRAPDERDRRYLMHRTRREAKGVIRRSWHSPGVLDQGMTSQCVVYACDKYLTTWPVRNNGFTTAKERARIYKEVQGIDEWGPPDDYDGTSVRAMMKWLKSNGYISDYHWAFECQPVIDHVLVSGPVEMGTVWDDGLSEPDRYGYIFSTTNEADDSGHAWTIVGADRERVHPKTKDVGAVRMVNSWGPSWGQGGRAWVTFKELDKLIRLAGEAAVANEVKRVA